MEPKQPIVLPIEVPNKKPNLSIIIFVIIIILSLGIIVLLFFQNQKLKKQITNLKVIPTFQLPTQTKQKITSISITTDETANWKTYVNQRCKYSVKFPSNWEKVDDPMIGEEAVYFKPMNINFISSDNASIIIEARPSKEIGVNNLQDKIDSYNAFLWKNWTNKKIEEINFKNTKAIKATGDNYGIPNIKILILANDCYYEIKGVGDYIQTFDQILSTFKFLDQTTNNTKTCGGFAGTLCPIGYRCKLDGSYPDASGVCIIQNNQQ